MSEQTLTPIGELIVDAANAAPPTPMARQITAEQHAALVEERKAIAERGGRPPKLQPTRDILIQKGYDAIAKLGPKVVARLESAVDNEQDPLHERAMDILSKRVVPIAFFESLAKQEFRTEEDGGAKPRIIINISTGGMPVKVEDAVDVPFTEKL